MKGKEGDIIYSKINQVWDMSKLKKNELIIGQKYIIDKWNYGARLFFVRNFNDNRYTILIKKENLSIYFESKLTRVKRIIKEYEECK